MAPVSLSVTGRRRRHISAELLENITGTAVDSPFCRTFGTMIRRTAATSARAAAAAQSHSIEDLTHRVGPWRSGL